MSEATHDLDINICPTCGSDQIRSVAANWSGKVEGQVYTVPKLRHHVCPACGEKVYGPTALRRIELASTAAKKRRASEAA